MFTLKNEGEISPNRILDIYLFFSFIVSLILWTSAYIVNDNYFLNGFFLTTLLVGNYLFFIKGIRYSFHFQEVFAFSGLFLFQIIMLIGNSFIEKHVGGLYLGLIPCVCAFYYFNYREKYLGTRHPGKVLALLFITLTSYLVFYGFTDINLITWQDGIYLLSFVLWGSALIIWGVERSGLDLLSFFGKNKRAKKESIIEYSEKEKFFIHDLINQTHGLNLFIGNRVGLKKGLSLEECRSVVDEIRLMQSLIKDHFGYRHKDLWATYEYVTFEFAKKRILELIKNYLPEPVVECRFSFKGNIAIGSNVAPDECLVHIPSLYRIINNLVKNIAESDCHKVEFIFDYQKEGLSIEIKNKILHLKDTKNDLDKSLGEVIRLHKKGGGLRTQSGLGLESVADICNDLGGSFHFELDGDYWVNYVFLPNPKFNISLTEDIRKAA